MIEVLVERLTYLFRLCFTGYFQIFVSPETFWLKDFNLVLRFSCCFNFKKPTHPSPNLFFVLGYHIVWFYTLIISFLARSSHPGKSWISFRFTAQHQYLASHPFSPPWRLIHPIQNASDSI